MIEPGFAWAAMTAVSSLATGAAAFVIGARRARATSERGADLMQRQLIGARDAAERRARELNAQNAVWRASTLAPRDIPGQPLYADRMAPMEHEALVELLRGLVLVDDAVIADPQGLARTREADAASAALAVLAGRVETLRLALAKVGAGVAEVRLETFDAVHVAVRLLTGRAQGAMLVVRSTSVKVSPLALDAVARVASGGAGEAQAPPLSSIWRGVTSRSRPDAGGPAAFFDDLEHELLRSELRGLVFGSHGDLTFSAADDGPTENVRAAAFAALDTFQTRAKHVLRGAGVARVDILLHGGGVVRWSALVPEAPWGLLIIADDGTTSPALVERLGGRLRRSIDTAPAPTTKGPQQTTNGALP